DTGCDFLRLATEIDHLPEEEAGHADIGNAGANLVRFPARESGEAEGVAEPEPLIDFRVDPELGSLPESNAGIERDIPGLASLIRMEAVLAAIGRVKREGI